MFIRSENKNQRLFCLSQHQTVNKQQIQLYRWRPQQDEELSELPDEAQLQVRDGEEDDGHDAQSQVVLPEPPGVVQDPLLVQELLPRAAADDEGHSHTQNRSCEFRLCVCVSYASPAGALELFKP